MVDKVEDAEMDCRSCGTKLVCHMSNYKGDFKNKLQWQNLDGTAHYKYNGHEYSCVIPDETQSPTETDSELDEYLNQKQEEIKNEHAKTEQQIAKVSDSLFSKDKLQTIDNEIDKLIVIESIVTKKLSTGDLPPNPAKVGMYMKFIYDKLENQK